MSLNNLINEPIYPFYKAGFTLIFWRTSAMVILLSAQIPLLQLVFEQLLRGLVHRSLGYTPKDQDCLSCVVVSLDVFKKQNKNLSFRERIPTFVIESEITGNNNMIRIVKVTSIGKYIETNPKVKGALEAWVSLVKTLTWEKPQDIVESFGAKAVDIIGGERAVIYVKWIGTHAAYSKLCKLNKQYVVEMFK